MVENSSRAGTDLQSQSVSSEYIFTVQGSRKKSEHAHLFQRRTRKRLFSSAAPAGRLIRAYREDSAVTFRATKKQELHFSGRSRMLKEKERNHAVYRDLDHNLKSLRLVRHHQGSLWTLPDPLPRNVIRAENTLRAGAEQRLRSRPIPACNGSP